eukprot:gene24967-57377_t
MAGDVFKAMRGRAATSHPLDVGAAVAAPLHPHS